MISEEMLNSIVAAIYDQNELYGVMIGFDGNGQCRMLNPGLVPSNNYGRYFVLIEALELTVQPPAMGIPARPTTIPAPTPVITNGSRVWRELIGAGLSCSLTVVSGISVAAGVAGELPTGGASTVLVVMGWTGLATSAAQCGNGLVRSWQVLANPDSNSLQQWDNNRYYETAFTIIDAVGITSSVVQLPFAVRNLLGILERRGSMMTADQLARLSRAERAARTEEALRRATQTPEGRRAIEAALRQANLTARQTAQVLGHGAQTARRAGVVSRVISAETTIRLNATLRDIISGVAGIGVSATPSSWTGSGSGSVNKLIVNVLGR